MQDLIEQLGTGVSAGQTCELGTEGAADAGADVTASTLGHAGEQFLAAGHISLERENVLRIDVGAEGLAASFGWEQALEEIADEGVGVNRRERAGVIAQCALGRGIIL